MFLLALMALTAPSNEVAATLVRQALVVVQVTLFNDWRRPYKESSTSVCKMMSSKQGKDRHVCYCGQWG